MRSTLPPGCESPRVGEIAWRPSKAIVLGYGEIAAMSFARGLSDRTIRSGIKELQSNDPLSSSRQRRAGGGRKQLESSQQDLVAAIDRFIEPSEVVTRSHRFVGGPARL